MKLSLSLFAITSLSILLTAALRPSSAQSENTQKPAATAAFFATTCDDTIVLTTTSAGRAINADGNARIRTDARGRQSFRVEIDANVHNGTTFDVYADGVLAGTLKVRAHRGQLEVDNEHGRSIPSGLDPVCSIKQVAVRNSAGTDVLDGTF